MFQNKINLIEEPTIKSYKFNSIISKENEFKKICLGEYIIPHSCSWMFSNLLESLGSAIQYHEFMSHPSIRGSFLIENRKISCFNYENSDGSTNQIIDDEIEGLSTIDLLVQASHGMDYNTAKILANFDLAIVQIFLHLLDITKEKIPPKQLPEIIMRLYLEPTCVYSDSEGIIFPSQIYLEIIKKIEKYNPKKFDLNTLKMLYEEVMQENKWINISPRHMRTIFSLLWASSIKNKNKKYQEISIRNFFELAFWCPLNPCFYVRPSDLRINRLNYVKLLSGKYVNGSIRTPLGKFIKKITTNLIKKANLLIPEEYGEEYLLQKELPIFASEYLYILMKDYKSENPKFFNRADWTIITKPIFPIAERSVKEFLSDYNKNDFETLLVTNIEDSLYYPDDCIKIIEKNASIIYDEINGLKNYIFLG